MAATMTGDLPNVERNLPLYPFQHIFRNIIRLFGCKSLFLFVSGFVFYTKAAAYIFCTVG